MQIGNKPVRDWKNILLDTGVILALLVKQSDDEGILFIKKLIGFLCKNKTGASENRNIYISTISLGEIITSESGQEKIKRVLKAIDSENVEFLSFDTNTALEFNIKLQPYLERDVIHDKARELGFKSQDYGMARQWISKDYMIAMTGFVKPVDVIITIDKNTFYPICKDFKTSTCILAYPELFEHSEQFILAYHYDKVDAFSKAPKVTVQNKKAVNNTHKVVPGIENIVDTPIIKLPRL